MGEQGGPRHEIHPQGGREDVHRLLRRCVTMPHAAEAINTTAFDAFLSYAPPGGYDYPPERFGILFGRAGLALV